MSKILTIYVNDQSVYEYDRDVGLEAQQLEFLDKMDTDMGLGIKIRGELILRPDLQQRATFVALNLLKALQQENDAVISASCAYLVNRCPNLTEIHANDSEQGIVIDLVDEKEDQDLKEDS